jgi:hypothetical protein
MGGRDIMLQHFAARNDMALLLCPKVRDLRQFCWEIMIQSFLVSFRIAQRSRQAHALGFQWASERDSSLMTQ